MKFDKKKGNLFAWIIFLCILVSIFSTTSIIHADTTTIVSNKQQHVNQIDDNPEISDKNQDEYQQYASINENEADLSNNAPVEHQGTNKDYNNNNPSEFDYLSTKPVTSAISNQKLSHQSTSLSSSLALDTITYTTLDPIFITSDSAFATEATNNGWPGDGSSATPYIIEGYDINGTSGLPPISIGSTTVYFEIRNNILRNSTVSNGIYLSDVSNAKVSNNQIYGNANDGIYIWGTNSEISSNIIYENEGSGISIENAASSSITIYNNTSFQNLKYGIDVHTVSSNIVLDSNRVSENDIYGIRVYNTDGVTIDNNNATYNHVGFYIAGSDNAQVTNNRFQYNDLFGIYRSLSDNVLIDSNQVLDNSYTEVNGFGINIYNSIGGAITNNEIGRNHDGVNIRYSSGITISNNFVYGSTYSGIATIVSVSSLDILENILTNNTTNGLYLNDLSSSTISHNDAYENGDNGIIGIGGGSNTYEYNNLTNNFGSGIRLSSSIDNTVQHNIFTHDGFQMMGPIYDNYKLTVFDNNTADGLPIVIIENSFTSLPTDFAQVIILNVTGITITGQNFANKEIPLAFAFCSNIVIEDNTFSHSTGAGLVLQHVNNSIIRNNVIEYSQWDGLLFSYAGENNLIENNQMYNSTYRGILLADIDFTTITGNDIHNNGHDDLAIVHSDNTTVTDNSIHDGGARFGVIFDGSENSTFTNNQVYNHNYDGIRYVSGSNNALISGILSNDNGWSGLYTQASNNIVVKNSQFLRNEGYGVRSYGCDQVIYDDNRIENSQSLGLSIDLSSHVTILRNYIYNSTSYGIGVSRTILTNIVNNTSNQNLDGITIWYNSDNSTIANNTIIGNRRVGIYSQGSNYNDIVSNFVKDSIQHGIYIETSVMNNINNNQLKNTGLYVIGSTVSALLQAEVNNNTVNGKPLVFVQQKHNGVWVEDAGQVVIIDSSFVYIEGLDLSNTTTGALIRHSDSITFSGNIVANTSYYGVILNQQTNNSIVVGNSFFANGLGFRITSQAVDHGWANYFGYNYWENGSKVDVNFDGISEVPYIIDGDAGNRDETPLTVPYSLVFVEVLNNDSLSQNEKASFFENIPPTVLYGGGGLAFLGLSGGTLSILRRRRKKSKNS